MYTYEIKQWIFSLKDEEIILSKKVYDNKFSYMKENTFHQLLARLCEEKYIGKIAKGLYYKPKENDYYRLPSHDKLLNFFINKGKNGMVVGDQMLYNYQIVDRRDNNFKIMTNIIPIKTKRFISNLEVEYVDADFKNIGISKTIEMLEMIEMIDDVKNINYINLESMIRNYASYYKEENLFEVLKCKKYKKRNLYALMLILDKYDIGNNIESLLNYGSIYKVPKAIQNILGGNYLEV